MGCLSSPLSPLTISPADCSVMFEEFVRGHEGSELQFEQLPFNHPLFIMYSSGTTGTPKCMVHSAGVSVYLFLYLPVRFSLRFILLFLLLLFSLSRGHLSNI